jgi:hypothetical protein
MGMLSLAVVGILAVGGPAAGSAGANTPKPKLKLEAAGEVLHTGAPILATSSNFFLNTPTGKLTCQETSLSGTLEANSEAKTDKAGRRDLRGRSCKRRLVHIELLATIEQTRSDGNHLSLDSDPDFQGSS